MDQAVHLADNQLKQILHAALGNPVVLHQLHNHPQTGQQADHDAFNSQHRPENLVRGSARKHGADAVMQPPAYGGIHLLDILHRYLRRLHVANGQQAQVMGEIAQFFQLHMQEAVEGRVNIGVGQRPHRAFLHGLIHHGNPEIPRLRRILHHDRLPKPFLAAKIIIGGGDVDGCLLGNHAHGSACIAVLGKQALRRVQQSFLGSFLSFHGGWGKFGIIGQRGRRGPGWNGCGRPAPPLWRTPPRTERT
ncbi:unknown [Akkermansia sp. CAG:344]|nr:unknown [Akkermansia sp. CAG:344]